MYKNKKHTLIEISILRILLVVGCLFVLASCGGGGDSSSAPTPIATVEKINDIVVPPEPDPVKNNANLTGIDSNNNGVRDDVERKIAAATSSNKIFNDSLEVAKLISKTTEEHTKETALILANKIDCASYKYNSIDHINIFNFFDNTEARSTAMLKWQGLLPPVTVRTLEEVKARILSCQ